MNNVRRMFLKSSVALAAFPASTVLAGLTPPPPPGHMVEADYIDGVMSKRLHSLNTFPPRRIRVYRSGDKINLAYHWAVKDAEDLVLFAPLRITNWEDAKQVAYILKRRRKARHLIFEGKQQ